MFCTFPGAPVLSREIISNLTIWLFISAKHIFQCVTDLIIHLLLSLSLCMEHLTDTLYSVHHCITHVSVLHHVGRTLHLLVSRQSFSLPPSGGGKGVRRKEKSTSTRESMWFYIERVEERGKLVLLLERALKNKWWQSPDPASVSTRHHLHLVQCRNLLPLARG